MKYMIYFIIRCYLLLVAFTGLNLANTTNNEEIDNALERMNTMANLMRGKNVSISQYNYLASVLVTNNAWWLFGAAVIINNKWLLTSTSILDHVPYTGVKIRIGSSYSYQEGELLDIEKYVTFPKHGQRDISEYVALIKLKAPLQFSKTVGQASLGSILPKKGENVECLGFGKGDHEEFGHLQKAETSFIDTKSCAPYYPMLLTIFNYCTNSSHSGPDFFDWGSPVLYKNKVIGVNILTTATNDNTTAPAVYLDITKTRYKKWIAETIKKN